MARRPWRMAGIRRMAERGANIIFVDLTDQQRVIEDFNAALGRAPVLFR